MDSNDPPHIKRPITTSEIARLCGLSRSTVSAVLNGKRNVREITRYRVLKCIREENYASGIVSKALVGQLSQMVAVLVPNAGLNPFHISAFRGISEVLDAHGYHVLLHNVRREDLSDPGTLASLQAYRPAGFLAFKGSEGPQGEHVRAILDERVPLVFHGDLEGLAAHCVTIDNRACERLITDYVIDKGHRRLGHLSGPAFSHGAKSRQLGFVESLLAHNIPVSDAFIVEAGETAEQGYHAAHEVLRDPKKRPTALVCFNDIVAMGAYRAAHELSLSIPGDVSVVGFDGTDVADLLGPQLTTVDVFPEQLGRQMARLLMRVIKNPTGRMVVEEVTPQLRERGSVRHV